MARNWRTLRTRISFSLANLLVGVLTVMAVFKGLPLRHWLVDGSTILAALGFGLATVGIWLPGANGARLAKIGLGIVFALGLLTIVGLVSALGALEGVHGALAQGSRLILVLVGALVVPYLVILPGLEVGWLQEHSHPRETL